MQTVMAFQLTGPHCSQSPPPHSTLTQVVAGDIAHVLRAQPRPGARVCLLLEQGLLVVVSTTIVDC